MADGARLLRPQRSQLTWDLIDLDSQLDPDHRARLVWDFVTTLELSALDAAVKARDDVAGRPASDPRVVLAVWLYATAEAIGSARAIERLCHYHAAYRWLCGGVPINHNLLSEFRRTQGDLLDRLLTDSLTALIDEGLLTLDEVIIDGTKVEALAGRGSMVQKPKLDKLAAAVGERVAALKREVESDGAAADRKQQKRRLRKAEEKAARIKRAHERMAELEREKAERAKQHTKAEAEKAAPSVSVSDPEVRLMKMPDGATRPGWNVQVATSHGFVVTIEPTDRRNDSGLAAGLVQQVADRCGVVPERLLADGSAMTQDEIVSLAESHPKLEVFSPPAKERENVGAETLRKRVWKHAHEPAVVKAWRERGRQGSVSAAQADGTCACQDEEPWLWPHAGAWQGGGADRVSDARAGAEPDECAVAAAGCGGIGEVCSAPRTEQERASFWALRSRLASRHRQEPGWLRRFGTRSPRRTAPTGELDYSLRRGDDVGGATAVISQAFGGPV